MRTLACRLFDQVVGAGKQGRWHGEVECFGSLESRIRSLAFRLGIPKRGIASISWTVLIPAAKPVPAPLTIPLIRHGTIHKSVRSNLTYMSQINSLPICVCVCVGAFPVLLISNFESPAPNFTELGNKKRAKYRREIYKSYAYKVQLKCFR
jgi:hypothetical protein